MTNVRRKNRHRAAKARRASGQAHAERHGPGIQGPVTVEHHTMMLRMARSVGLPDSVVSAALLPNRYAPPVLDNFALSHAAAGALTIGDPDFRPPAPIDFPPPRLAPTETNTV